MVAPYNHVHVNSHPNRIESWSWLVDGSLLHAIATYNHCVGTQNAMRTRTQFLRIPNASISPNRFKSSPKNQFYIHNKPLISTDSSAIPPLASFGVSPTPLRSVTLGNNKPTEMELVPFDHDVLSKIRDSLPPSKTNRDFDKWIQYSHEMLTTSSANRFEGVSSSFFLLDSSRIVRAYVNRCTSTF